MKSSELSCKEDYLKIQRQFRFAAFISVVISTAALLGSVLAVPIFYHYALRINNLAENDFDFCKMTTKNLWSRLLQYVRRVGPDDRAVPFFLRNSRKAVWSFVNPKLEGKLDGKSEPSVQANFDENSLHGSQFKEEDKYTVENEFNADTIRSDTLPYANGKCCTCQQGAAGPPGQPGAPGHDGVNGSPGNPGRSGDDAPPGFKPPPCQRPCPPGPPGPPGAQGEKGPQGNKGNEGQPGPTGPNGERGPAGSPGEQGLIGGPGEKGPAGSPGHLIKQIAPQGPPGPPGVPGPPGPAGLPGPNGKIGPQGPIGEKGDAGEVGFPGRPGTPGPVGPLGGPGLTGSCVHCPPPRLPPGY